MSTVAVGPDTFVTIAYTLAEDGGAGAKPSGDAAERVTVSYVHGYGQVLPVLEEGLAGEVQGAFLTLVAEPDDAFGPHEAEGLLEIDREGLDLEEGLEPGEEIVASGPEGDMLMRVVEVREDSILVDTNHPLAGKRVRFDVEVLEVRAATEEEIQEAQDDLEDMIDDGCGCGHDHSSGAHAGDDEGQLVQLARPKAKA